VFNIGREQGTWMPGSWAASGERLRFQVLCDFTSEPLYDREEFFHGIAGVKKLEIVDAWTLPCGRLGRMPVDVKPVGGYKVVPGQGPMGTDVVRLYIELKEPLVKPESDVYCPSGRVYGTCGYFPTHSHKASDGRSMKEICADDYYKAVVAYEGLQQEMQAETRPLAWEKLKKYKELYDMKQQVDKLNRRLQEAKQRDPDRSQIRLSRKGDLGLSKEGGVCCKVQKGLTLEYHILGRMELGSVEVREEHDEYDDLLHELHP
jgi:hypothetical protein